ncbi:predicted protein, partial [Arabidopsis lyrata subsp. lyrata]
LLLCYNAKTLSFRVGDDMIKTVNSVFFDHNNNNGGDMLEVEELEPCLLTRPRQRVTQPSRIKTLMLNRWRWWFSWSF